MDLVFVSDFSGGFLTGHRYSWCSRRHCLLINEHQLCELTRELVLGPCLYMLLSLSVDWGGSLVLCLSFIPVCSDGYSVSLHTTSRFKWWDLVSIRHLLYRRSGSLATWGWRETTLTIYCYFNKYQIKWDNNAQRMSRATIWHKYVHVYQNYNR